MPRHQSPRPSRVTLRDVAREAGVAVPTASLVLSGATGTRIAAATAARIRGAAERLGYTPHFAMRLLQGGETGIVALCISGPRLARDETIRDLVQATGEKLMHDGRKMYLAQFSEQPEKDLEDLLDRGARAFLFAGSPPSHADILSRLDRENIPWAGYASPLPRNVRADVRSGVAALARAVLQSGRERIAAVLQDADNPHVPCERWHGLQDALGFKPPLSKPDPQAEDTEETICDSAARATRLLLSARERPQAIFYHTDLHACGGVRAILEAGLTPGKEVLVVGVNDSVLSRHGAFPFPSVRFDPPAMAAALSELLLRPGPALIRIPVTPIYRGLPEPAGP